MKPLGQKGTVPVVFQAQQLDCYPSFNWILPLQSLYDARLNFTLRPTSIIQKLFRRTAHNRLLCHQ